MAKAFLLRWGTQSDFDSIKLQTREMGFAVDSEKLYFGTDDANIHVPQEAYVQTMINAGIKLYKPTIGTTLSLSTIQALGTLAYDTDTNRLKYKTTTAQVINLATKSDLPSFEPTTVVVETENIDTADENSVLIAGYNRPTVIIFLNGILCTGNDADPHQYTLDSANNTIKIKECAINDIIAYF